MKKFVFYILYTLMISCTCDEEIIIVDQEIVNLKESLNGEWRCLSTEIWYNQNALTPYDPYGVNCSSFATDLKIVRKLQIDATNLNVNTIYACTSPKLSSWEIKRNSDNKVIIEQYDLDTKKLEVIYDKYYFNEDLTLKLVGKPSTDFIAPLPPFKYVLLLQKL